jgi:hypothetical protein
MILLIWFGIVIIFQNETLNLQEMYTLLKIHIHTTRLTQDMWYIGEYISFFLKKSIKDFIQKSFLWNFFDKNTIVLKGKISILAYVSLFVFGILSWCTFWVC